MAEVQARAGPWGARHPLPRWARPKFRLCSVWNVVNVKTFPFFSSAAAQPKTLQRALVETAREGKTAAKRSVELQ